MVRITTTELKCSHNTFSGGSQFEVCVFLPIQCIHCTNTGRRYIVCISEQWISDFHGSWQNVCTTLEGIVQNVLAELIAL